MTIAAPWPSDVTPLVHVAAPPDTFALAPRALVVAADPVVRRALVAALRAPSAPVEVTALASLALTLDAPAHDVIVWDLGADPLAVVDHFTASAAPAAPLIALVPAAAFARDALAWGARGALPRDADDETLAAALRAVLHGLTVLASEFTEGALARDPAEAPGAAAPSGEGLTARELEVLALVAEGLPNKLIAHRLGISDHTVKFHVNAVLAKLGAQSRTEAVVRAARRGMLVL